MKPNNKSTVGAVAILASLTLLPAAVYASDGHHRMRGEVQGAVEKIQPAHMDRGATGEMRPGQGHESDPCQSSGRSHEFDHAMMGMMMEHDMLAHGMMGSGPRFGVAPDMMASGGRGGFGYNFGRADGPDRNLSVDEVRAQLERDLIWNGNKRLELGEVKEGDGDTVIADIVTKDGSLVQRFMIDRHTGEMRDVE